MPRQNPALLAFNRGIISQKALARVDLERIPFSAETQRNWIPRTFGSMTLRPGLQYISDNLTDPAGKSRLIPFIKSSLDSTFLRFTSGGAMNVWSDGVVVEAPTHTAQITNGSFTTSIDDWDAVGAIVTVTSSWDGDGYLHLSGDGTNYASREQQVTINETGVTHVLRVEVERGPVNLRVGGASNGNDYIDTMLDTGVSSVEFVPTGDVWVGLRSNAIGSVLVDTIEFMTGAVSIDSPYLEADLPNIRFAQSGDVIFVACKDYKPMRIERRGTYAWAVVEYDPEDGPFGVLSASSTTLRVDYYNGDVSLVTNNDMFTQEDIGRLFRLESQGQYVERIFTTDAIHTEHLNVTGVGTSRDIAISIQQVAGGGAPVLTATLQRSIGGPGAWEDVIDYSTFPLSTTYNDTLDNQVIYYRLRVASGSYTSGIAKATMAHTGGTQTGIVKAHAYVSTGELRGRVLKTMGSTSPTADWYAGLWSDRTGWPTSVAIFEGRVWWAGQDYFIGSESDRYYSFGLDTIGDAATIVRQIGFGPVDDIYWLMPAQRLLAGTTGNVITARSTSFDEPLTPTNFNMKDATTHGASNVDAVKVDTYGVYVHRSRRRIMELAFDGRNASYTASDATALVPELAGSDIVRIAVQRMPDTRVHAVLADGTVMLMVVDPVEETRAWVTIDTDGLIEDAVVLPGDVEDQVYYMINRGGSRYLARWAQEIECEGGLINKQADAFIVSTGQVITGLDHLEGETVVAWADGADIGTFTVSSGQVDLGASYTDVVVGLPYDAEFKSSKLSYAAGMGTALAQRKKVTHLALLMYKTHCQGVKYGTDPDNLDDLPLIEKGELVPDDTIHDTYDSDSFEVNGSWGSDERLILTAAAPRPATIMAAIPTVVTHDKG